MKRLKEIDIEFLQEHRQKLHILVGLLSKDPWTNEDVLLKIDKFITKSKQMETEITECLKRCLKGGEDKCQ